jgi:hypothetical protein
MPKRLLLHSQAQFGIFTDNSNHLALWLNDRTIQENEVEQAYVNRMQKSVSSYAVERGYC